MADGGTWIPTERWDFNSYLIVGITGAFFLVIIALALQDSVVQAVGAATAASEIGAAFVVTLLIDVWGWTQANPSAIRVSASGIEVRRRFRKTVTVPADKVSLWAVGRAGFGHLRKVDDYGVTLSPNQVTAVREFFPVSRRISRWGAQISN